MQYFHVSKHWYGCQRLGFLTYVLRCWCMRLYAWPAQTPWESLHRKLTLGEKSLCPTGTWTHISSLPGILLFSWMLYPLSYLPFNIWCHYSQFSYSYTVTVLLFFSNFLCIFPLLLILVLELLGVSAKDILLYWWSAPCSVVFFFSIAWAEIQGAWLPPNLSVSVYKLWYQIHPLDFTLRVKIMLKTCSGVTLKNLTSGWWQEPVFHWGKQSSVYVDDAVQHIVGALLQWNKCWNGKVSAQCHSESVTKMYSQCSECCCLSVSLYPIMWAV